MVLFFCGQYLLAVSIVSVSIEERSEGLSHLHGSQTLWVEPTEETLRTSNQFLMADSLTSMLLDL